MARRRHVGLLWMSNKTFDGDGGAWFGRPGRPGQLRGEGGWAGYFLDGMEVHAFGEWWACIAVGSLGSMCIGLLGILTYSPHTLTGPCRAVGRLLISVGVFFAAAGGLRALRRTCRALGRRPLMSSGTGPRLVGPRRLAISSSASKVAGVAAASTMS